MLVRKRALERTKKSVKDLGIYCAVLHYFGFWVYKRINSSVLKDTWQYASPLSVCTQNSQFTFPYSTGNEPAWTPVGQHQSSYDVAAVRFPAAELPSAGEDEAQRFPVYPRARSHSVITIWTGCAAMRQDFCCKLGLHWGECRATNFMLWENNSRGGSPQVAGFCGLNAPIVAFPFFYIVWMG